MDFTSAILPAVQTLIGLIGVCLALDGLFRRRKVVRWRVVATQSLITVPDALAPQVKVTFDGTDVTTLHWTTVRIWNAGNVPIPTGDFDNPITVGFGKDAKVLSASLGGSSPSVAAADAPTIGDGIVTLPNCLLNPGDTLDVTVVATTAGSEWASAGIVGIQKVLRFDEQSHAQEVGSVLVGLLAVAAIEAAAFILSSAIFFHLPVLSGCGVRAVIRRDIGRGGALGWACRVDLCFTPLRLLESNWVTLIGPWWPNLRRIAQFTERPRLPIALSASGRRSATRSRRQAGSWFGLASRILRSRPLLRPEFVAHAR